MQSGISLNPGELLASLYREMAEASRNRDGLRAASLLHPSYSNRDDEISRAAAGDNSVDDSISDVRVESRQPGRIVLVATVRPENGAAPIRQRVLLLNESGSDTGQWQLGGVQTLAGRDGEVTHLTESGAGGRR